MHIVTCVCLCVCHVESLNVSNFCLSDMSYVSLKFSCSCDSKYLNMAFTVTSHLDITDFNNK